MAVNDQEKPQPLDLSKFKFEGGYAPETVVQQVQHMAKSGFSPEQISELVGKMTVGELTYDPTAGLTASPTSWVREYVQKGKPADFGGIASYAAAQGLSDQDVFNALQPYTSYGAAYDKSGLGGIHSLQQLSDKLNWRGNVNPAVAADAESYSEPASVAQYAIANGIVNRYTGEVENPRALDALTKTYDLNPEDVSEQIEKFTIPYALVGKRFRDESPVQQVVSTESLEQKIGDRKPGFVYNPLAVARSKVFEATPSELASVEKNFQPPSERTLKKLLELVQRMNTTSRTQKFAEGGLSSRTRQFMMEDDPSFNLGMDANAFRSLGMGELADIQNLGLMSLPGAETTVANPAVVSQIQNQVQAQEPTTTAKDLFDYYATGFKPDQTALDFWNNKIGTLGYEDTLNEFLNPAQGAAAPRFSIMSQDPDYLKIAKPTPVIPAVDMKPEPREIVDPGWLGDNINIFGQPESQQKTAVTTPAAEAAQTTQAAATPVTAATTAAPAVDTSNFPKFEGKPYDPAAYDNIVKQLTAQQQALLQQKNFPYTSTFGGAQETIADMAKRLAAMGISDIRDFGQKFQVAVEKEEPYLMYQDEGPPIQVDTGKYRTIDGIEGYTSENEPIYKYRYLTDDEVKKLKRDEDGNLSLVLDQSDLPNDPYAKTLYYNKKTGEILDSQKFGSKAESGIWASSGAGDGFTDYRVMYTKEGIPVFMPHKQFSGMKEFITEDLQGILSILQFLPGAQIPVMVAQAAAAAYMGAKPEDILKSAAISYLSSNLGKLGDKFLPQLGFDLPTSDLGKLAMNAGYSGLASLIQGGDFEDALKSAGLSAVGTGISGLLPKGGEGDINYGRLIQAAAPALAKGKLTNADIFRIMSSLAPTKQKVPGKP